jgi:membrane protein
VDLLRPIRAFDRVQQKHSWLALPVAVFKKFADDQGGRLAALVAYYAFFSLFPLLLMLVTILGFVLQGDAEAQESVKNSVLGQFPVIGDQIKVNALTGHTVALLVGLLGSLWGGLGVTQAMQGAFDRIWAVPFKHRRDFLRSRLRGLVFLFSLGGLFLIASVASGLVIGGLGGTWVKAAGIVFSLGLNFALFFLSFRFLTVNHIPTRQLLVGVTVASVVWELLQLVGGYYIGHIYRHSSDTYAQFALVIALMVWLHLGAQITVYAAEVNVVVVRRLWPRNLIGPPDAAADEATLRALAMVEERSPEEHVDVHFR